MCFPAAIRANQQEPACWRRCKRDCQLKSFLHPRHIQVKGCKTFFCEVPQIGKLLELLVSPDFDLLLFALAGHYPPKIGMPNGYIPTEESRPFTERTYSW